MKRKMCACRWRVCVSLHDVRTQLKEGNVKLTAKYTGHVSFYLQLYTCRRKNAGKFNWNESAF